MLPTITKTYRPIIITDKMPQKRKQEFKFFSASFTDSWSLFFNAVGIAEANFKSIQLGYIYRRPRAIYIMPISGPIPCKPAKLLIEEPIRATTKPAITIRTPSISPRILSRRAHLAVSVKYLLPSWSITRSKIEVSFWVSI